MTGTFTIEAGQHYCTPRYPFLFYGKEMTRIVRFDPSCIYKGLPDGKEPINKLFGFCELWPSVHMDIAFWMNNEPRKPLHHYDSARFGWNCNERGELWLYAYSYADGVREWHTMCQVVVSKDIECSILVKNGCYIFELVQRSENIISRRVPVRTATGSRAFGFGLFPYFGGDGTCPHNMSIAIRKP